MGELLTKRLRKTRRDGENNGAMALPTNGHVTILTTAPWPSRHPKSHGGDGCHLTLAPVSRHGGIPVVGQHDDVLDSWHLRSRLQQGDIG